MCGVLWDQENEQRKIPVVSPYSEELDKKDAYQVCELDENALPEPELDQVRISKGDLRNAWPLKTPLEEVRKKQKEDCHIQPVLKWKESETRPSEPEVQAASPATRHYLLNWESLVLKDGVLYKWFHRKDGTMLFQLIFPRCMREDVMHQMHDTVLSGHLGNKKTRQSVRQ
jgi:hypothetical protein